MTAKGKKTVDMINARRSIVSDFLQKVLMVDEENLEVCTNNLEYYVTEKVLMQLEKERAQLDLELDRLAAEKIKLHMEIDTLSGRAEAAQQELETEKAKLEAEAAKLEREKASLEAAASAPASAATSASARVTEEKETGTIAENFRLINVIGAGSQLQATVEALDTGQTKRIRVGSVLDGFSVKSISLDDGVVFVKDGKSQTLNIGGNR